jgi:pimeloyl-ACP methyl ester carboxylesterase
MSRHSQLARLLQCSVFAQLGAAICWTAWRWPASPGQAIGGMALVLLAGPLVLALEVLISACVSRSDPVAPQPTAAQLLRAWLAESGHLFSTFWWRQPFRWRAVPDHLDAACTGRTGVVFVHGFMCNRGFWNAWMQRLREQGRGYVAVNLEPAFASIDAYADAIDQAVRQLTETSGRPPMVVCHSMGGLAARAWWRAGGSVRQVAAFVTIATPHGGTWMGRFSRRANGRQMRLHSAWLQALARHEAGSPLPPTTCWYSNCDNIVFPSSTATLAGADNRFVPGQPHVALAFQPAVLAGCLALLQQCDAMGQVKSVTAPCAENG